MSTPGGVYVFECTSCCSRHMQLCAVLVFVCVSHIFKSACHVFSVNRWSCQSVWCSLKRERKWFFFSNHSVETRACYEMTAVIKVTQWERQALLSHTQTYTFTSLHCSWQVKDWTHRANKTCCGNCIRFGCARLGWVWHLHLIADPWCASAGLLYSQSFDFQHKPD